MVGKSFLKALPLIALLVVGFLALASAYNLVYQQPSSNASGGANELQSDAAPSTQVPTLAPTASVNPTQAQGGGPAIGKQVVDLSWRDGNYFPQEIRVKKNVPVELRVDLSTVVGCMRTVVIPGLNIRKTVSDGDNVISFTASEAGVYPYSCGMGMGTGKIVVEA